MSSINQYPSFLEKAVSKIKLIYDCESSKVKELLEEIIDIKFLIIGKINLINQKPQQEDIIKHNIITIFKQANEKLSEIIKLVKPVSKKVITSFPQPKENKHKEISKQEKKVSFSESVKVREF